MSEPKYDVWDMASRFALMVVLGMVLALGIAIGTETGAVGEADMQYLQLAIYALTAYAIIPPIEVICSSSVPLAKEAYRRATA